MNLLPSEAGLYMRFDAFCKKVMARTNYKLLREELKRKDRECVFSDLEEGVLEQYYYTNDSYPGLAFWIYGKNMKIFIENEMLYHALLLLPEKRLEIIILSFFADMTDKEIGEIILMPQSSVQYNRKAALRNIKETMEVGIPLNEKKKKTR